MLEVVNVRDDVLDEEEDKREEDRDWRLFTNTAEDKSKDETEILLSNWGDENKILEDVDIVKNQGEELENQVKGLDNIVKNSSKDPIMIEKK